MCHRGIISDEPVISCALFFNGSCADTNILIQLLKTRYGCNVEGNL